MKLQLQPVVSSHIKAMAYDPDTKRLLIQFHKGGEIYGYDGIPQATYGGLKSADSVGGYFAKHIKPHYHGVRLTVGEESSRTRAASPGHRGA